MKEYKFNIVSKKKYFIVVILALIISIFIVSLLLLMFKLNWLIYLGICFILYSIFFNFLKKKLYKKIKIVLRNDSFSFFDEKETIISYGKIEKYRIKTMFTRFALFKINFNNGTQFKFHTDEKYDDFEEFLIDFKNVIKKYNIKGIIR